jgi:hypothetical protein
MHDSAPVGKTAGIFHYFYHCRGEELPVRDVLDTQRHGPKEEPHYENLTENWCTKCMERRIRSANRNAAEFLFLMTRYFNPGSKMHGKRIVVGFLHRAKPERWRRLNATLRRGARKYDQKNPSECDFFVGDEQSHFVAAKHGFLLHVPNCRWDWRCDEKRAVAIVASLRQHRNILPELKRRVRELRSSTGLRHRAVCG